MAIRQQSQRPIPLMQTQALELVDRQGHVRARLDLDEADDPCLQFLTAQGKVRFGFNASGFCLYDDQGKPRATLGVDNRDGVCFALVGEDGSAAIVITVGNWPGQAVIRTYDVKGRLAWASPLRAERGV